MVTSTDTERVSDMAGHCMVPDLLRGVRMSHSDDVVEVWHGMDAPAVGCGFHATYYASELFEAHRNQGAGK